MPSGRSPRRQVKGENGLKIIDLTHTIFEQTPVYPGTPQPTLETLSTYEKDGFRETLLTLASHTGTHMDAPAHIFADGTTLEHIPAQQFVGTALVLSCSDLQAGEQITMRYIEQARPLADSVDFLLFDTGWSKHWGTDAYFGDYPYMTEEVADYLINSGKKGVGLDVIGVDPISDANLTIHNKIFSQSQMVIVENLIHLDQIGEGVFTFCALPLKFRNADGAPVRAIAIVES